MAGNIEKHNFKTVLAAAALLLMLSAAGLYGCTGISQKAAAPLNSETQETGSTLSEATAQTAETSTTIVEAASVEAIDGMGNKITLDKPARRVIVFSPSVLEIFYGLDSMDKVAEVDSWSVQNNDPLAKGFKGAGDANGINFEVVAKINPDLIVVEGEFYASNPEESVNKLVQLGYKVYQSSSKSLEKTYAEIESIGRLIGKEEEGIALSSDLKTEVENIYSKVKDIPENSRPTVFFMVWNDPIMSAGKNTFIDELISKAGGINIVSRDGLSDWPEYSLEKLVANNPDIIIAPFSLAPTQDTIIQDSKFSAIKAVTDKRVYCVPDNPISRPNQNIIKGLSMFASAINPEIFGEFKVIE